jgi:hypothetical protein
MSSRFDEAPDGATGRLGIDATGRRLRTGLLFGASDVVAGSAIAFGRDVGLGTGAGATFGRGVGLSTGAGAAFSVTGRGVGSSGPAMGAFGASATGATEPAVGVGRCRATGALVTVNERLGALLWAMAGETSLGAAGGMPFGAFVGVFDTVGATLGEVLSWAAEVFRVNGADDVMVAFDAFTLFVVVGVAAGEKVTLVVFEVELVTVVALVVLLDELPVGKRLGASLGVSVGCALGTSLGCVLGILFRTGDSDGSALGGDDGCKTGRSLGDDDGRIDGSKLG